MSPKCPECGSPVFSVEGRHWMDDSGKTIKHYAVAYHCGKGHSWPAPSVPFWQAVAEARP